MCEAFFVSWGGEAAPPSCRFQGFPCASHSGNEAASKAGPEPPLASSLPCSAARKLGRRPAGVGSRFHSSCSSMVCSACRPAAVALARAIAGRRLSQMNHCSHPPSFSPIYSFLCALLDHNGRCLWIMPAILPSEGAPSDSADTGCLRMGREEGERRLPSSV